MEKEAQLNGPQISEEKHFVIEIYILRNTVVIGLFGFYVNEFSTGNFDRVNPKSTK
jgi:hypothetical protein